MTNPDEVTLVARFDAADPADKAAQQVLSWEKAHTSGRFGAVAVLTRDAQGELQMERYAKNSSAKGLKVGAGLGALAAVLSGGLTLIPTTVAGAVAGGLLGRSKKRLQLSEMELERLWSELADGRAVLVATCDRANAAALTEQLTLAGGRLDATP